MGKESRIYSLEQIFFNLIKERDLRIRCLDPQTYGTENTYFIYTPEHLTIQPSQIELSGHLTHVDICYFDSKRFQKINDSPNKYNLLDAMVKYTNKTSADVITHQLPYNLTNQLVNEVFEFEESMQQPHKGRIHLVE